MLLLGGGFASCGRPHKVPWTRGFKATEMHYFITLEGSFFLRENLAPASLPALVLLVTLGWL